MDGTERQELVTLAQSMFARGLTPGRTGNLSVRVGDHIVATPTGSSLGFLDPTRLAVVDLDGHPVAGDPPTKELPLHLAVYRARADLRAVAHLHSPHAVAVSTLRDLDTHDVLPALTPYFVMRVGRLPLAPYAAPGSRTQVPWLRRAFRDVDAVLLANHGSLAGGTSLPGAVDLVEEIEATAQIHLLTRGLSTRPLTATQILQLRSS